MKDWLKKILATLTVLACALSLSACGFHLLGANTTQTLPNSVAIIGNTDNEIIESLKAQKPDNILPATPEYADLTLEFGDVNTGKSVLSKTAAGTVSEYRVSLSIVLQVYDKHKNQLLAPTRLTTSRNLIVGTGYATAEDAELERLNTDMAHELANSIVYRVRAVWFTHQKPTQ
jgi:LPS-assembly lipoprotein